MISMVDFYNICTRNLSWKLLFENSGIKKVTYFLEQTVDANYEGKSKNKFS